MGEYRRQRLADSAGPTHRAARYLPAAGNVSPKLGFHGLCERRILDEHVELIVSQEARRVEIARSYSHPAVIAHDALGVQHGSVPLIDPDPASEQVPVPDPRQVPDERKIARSRYQ
jgi:hypothetical protein